MRNGKSLLAAAALLTVAAPAAQASEYRTFTHDGVTYTYRIIEKGDKKIIVGTSKLLGQSKKLTLTVKNGKVRGNVDGRKVTFTTSEARAQNTRLASD